MTAVCKNDYMKILSGCVNVIMDIKIILKTRAAICKTYQVKFMIASFHKGTFNSIE